MELGTLIWIIVLTVGPLALMLFADARGMFDQIGGGPFSTEQLGPTPTSSGGGATSSAEREAEIRQLVQASIDRRVARGQPPLDLDAEVERLLALDPGTDPDVAPGADGELREEVRQLVIARNERRLSKGLEPLDIEEEIERSLREAGA